MVDDDDAAIVSYTLRLPSNSRHPKSRSKYLLMTLIRKLAVLSFHQNICSLSLSLKRIFRCCCCCQLGSSWRQDFSVFFICEKPCSPLGNDIHFLAWFLAIHLFILEMFQSLLFYADIPVAVTCHSFRATWIFFSHPQTRNPTKKEWYIQYPEKKESVRTR